MADNPDKFISPFLYKLNDIKFKAININTFTILNPTLYFN